MTNGAYSLLAVAVLSGATDHNARLNTPRLNTTSSHDLHHMRCYLGCLSRMHCCLSCLSRINPINMAFVWRFVAFTLVLHVAASDYTTILSEWTIVGAASRISGLGAAVTMSGKTVALGQAGGAFLSNEDDKVALRHAGAEQNSLLQLDAPLSLSRVVSLFC